MTRSPVNITKALSRLPARSAGGVAGPGRPHRIYCYEPYHQLRNVLDSERLFEGYALNGESDKQAPPIIRPGAPGLLFHVPGHRNQNPVVVEVKPINAKPEGITKNVKNLGYFVSEEVGYQRGVLLVCGDDGRGIARFENALPERGRECASTPVAAEPW